MLFGRKKRGFVKIEEVKEFQHEVNEDRIRAVEETAKKINNDASDLIDKLNDINTPLAASDVNGVEIERTKAQMLADFIRQRSNGGYLTKKSALEAEDENLKGLLDELKADETCQDITTIDGNKDVYFYSVDYMSDYYAKVAMLIEEDDLQRTIATIVRHNAKIYPSPTPVLYFTISPYNYTEIQVNNALKKMKDNEEYSDICELTTENDIRYLYSTLHMSEKYAKALAEEVERGEEG
ncbi:MAG: hypothetical protein GX214_08640 [Clostridiales bacterium]|nr:hypothetical protein [Clostridiales bacterium]